MLSANEIALEAKVKVLEEDLKGYKDFESKIIASFTMIILGSMTKDYTAASKSLDKIQDIITERMEAQIKKSQEARNS